MDRRSAERKRQLLADCEVSPAVFAGIEERVGEFVAPFAARLGVPEQRTHAGEYVMGLLSGVERKNIESIAYLHGQDRSRRAGTAVLHRRGGMGSRPVAGRVGELGRAGPGSPGAPG